MTKRIVLPAVALVAACAGPDTNHPIGTLQAVDLTLQPARVPPHPNGALMLSAATGCYVEFVGKASGEHVYRFRIGATQRMPDVARCMSSLRAQPGVTGAEPVP